VTVTGMANKPPKIKEDNTIDLVLKVETSPSVPKGLKPLGASICLVHIGPKTWKKIATIVKDDSFYIIQGEAKASVSNKNTPFFEVVAFDISLKAGVAATKEQTNKKTPEEVVKKQEEETVKKPKEEVKAEKKEAKEKQSVQKKQQPKKSQEKEEKKPMFCEWYKEEEIIFVSHKELVLTEEIHLTAKILQLNNVFKIVNINKTIKAPMAIKPVGDGKYSLVMGLKHYVAVKVFGLEKVPAVIRNMTYDEFLEAYMNK